MTSHMVATFVDPVVLFSAAAGGLMGLILLARRSLQPKPRRAEVRSTPRR